MLDCIVEELELRFSEEEVEGLVRALGEVFGSGEEDEEANGIDGERDRWEGVSEERRRMIESQEEKNGVVDGKNRWEGVSEERRRMIEGGE